MRGDGVTVRDGRGSRAGRLLKGLLVLTLAFAMVAAWSSSMTAQGKPLKVGALLALTGPLALNGESVLVGLDMALTHAQHRVAGRQIQLIKEDTQGNPNIGLQKVKQLIDRDDVDIIVGPISSAVAAAIRDTVHQKKKILVVPMAGDIEITKMHLCSPYIFRVGINNWNQAYPFGTWARKHIADRFYLAGSNFAYGQQSTRFFTEAFERAGGKIVGKIMVSLGTKDYGPYLTQIAAADPPALFVIFPGSDGVNFVKQFHDFGLKKKMKITNGTSTFSDDNLPAQGEAAVGAITSANWAPTLDTPTNRRFMEAVRKFSPRTNPSFSVVQGYDSGLVVLKALEQSDGDPRPDRLIPLLERMKIESPRGVFEFDEQHEGIYPMYVVEIRMVGGKPTPVVVENLGRVKTPNMGCTMGK